MPKLAPAKRTANPDRRHARQARSKATVQRILDSAVALTVEKGADRVTMTEIARRADVVIGALYRYFADKAAINQAIVLRHYEDSELLLKRALAPVRSAAEFISAVQAAYELYFDQHQSDPVYKSIWSIVQTDAKLQALDVEDTLKNARFFCSVSRPLFPRANPEKLTATSVFVLHFAAQSSRLALELPKTIGRQMRPIYRQMIADLFGALC